MEMKVIFSSGGEKNGEKEAARGKRERRHLLAKKNFSDGSWIHTNQFSLKKIPAKGRRRKGWDGPCRGRGRGRGGGCRRKAAKNLYRFCAPIRRLICIAIRLRWPSSET